MCAFLVLEETMPELGLAGFGVPVILIGAVVVITVATLLLHLIFPPAKSRNSQHITLSSMPKTCPLCQERLDEVERHGILMEVCSHCHGIWLSQGKLEQIIN
jgi:Transcription factor zinc-finger